MIGLISDTHDNIDAIKAAVDIFNDSIVERVLHAGDLVSPFTAVHFAKLQCPMTVVLGNNEGELLLLKKKFGDIGVDIQDFAEVEVGGKRIAVYHGTVPAITQSLLECSKYDVVVTGHTHETKLEKVGDSLWINPGEACSWLYGKSTVALLDLATMECEFVEL